MAPASDRFSIAIVTRELWPFVTGGGIGRTARAVANLLAPVADVTVVTRDDFREQYEALRAAGDPRLPDERVRLDFITDPRGWELGPFWSFHHAWSARVYQRLCELYPDGGPDLVEFGDYLAEGLVTIQARRSGRPSMRNALAVVRLHGTAEMMAHLNAEADPDLERRGVYMLERNCIAFADALLTPGGSVLEDFQRFYGTTAPGVVVPHAFELPELSEPAAANPADGPLRLVYVGRLQRVKGVDSLVRAALAIPDGDFELTLVGGDTDTAPGGASMRAYLENLTGGDERISFTGQVPHEQVLKLMKAGDLVVIPSRWESWSNVAREALLCNRPVLATPAGGVHLTVVPGRSGWVARDRSEEAIRDALADVLERREEVRALIDARAPRGVLHELLDQSATIDAYRALAAYEREGPVEAHPAAVSAVVVRSRGDDALAPTLESLAAQTVPVLETIASVDGRDRMPGLGEAELLDRLIVLEREEGRPAAREAAVAQARGELVLLIDSGTVLHPGFVEEALRALGASPTAAYATAWAAGIDPRAVPVGNFADLVPELETAAACALFRRDALGEFPQGSDGCAERKLYTQLADAGRFGVVIPKILVERAPFSRPCSETAETAVTASAPA